MNQPAIDFYRDKGVDLYTQPLEIALCAQHNNGGLGIDCWWQTNVKGLFAVGEAAASHGVYRPGGTALNAGQVGTWEKARETLEGWRWEKMGTIRGEKAEKKRSPSSCVTAIKRISSEKWPRNF